MNPKSKRLCFWFPRSLIARLDRIRSSRGLRSRTELVVRILEWALGLLETGAKLPDKLREET